MSFILDALRKSEHERQRSTVPGLAHVPLATAPAQLPRWAVAAIAALGVAVLVLAGAWWQSTRSSGTATVAPQSAGVRSVALPPPTATAGPAASERGQAAGSLENAATQEPGPATPAATTSSAFASLPASAAPSRAGDDNVPTAAALAAQGVALPPLRLELHAFTEQPRDRYVFINGRKYVEGERLPEGTQIVSITPIGAVLSQYGQRFLLVPE